MIGNGFFDFKDTSKPKKKVTKPKKKAPVAKAAATGPAAVKERLSKKTVDELYKMAKTRKIDGRSKMKKKELVTAICKEMTK